jgi:uncharacterized coiled-coil DUF342 family protein
LNQTKEHVLKYSETNEEYEAQILALQKEYNEAHEKLRESENKIIEMNQKIAEMEQDNLAINDLQAQLDRYEAEVTDKNKVCSRISENFL